MVKGSEARRREAPARGAYAPEGRRKVKTERVEAAKVK